MSASSNCFQLMSGARKWASRCGCRLCSSSSEAPYRAYHVTDFTYSVIAYMTFVNQTIYMRIRVQNSAGRWPDDQWFMQIPLWQTRLPSDLLLAEWRTDDQLWCFAKLILTDAVRSFANASQAAVCSDHITSVLFLWQVRSITSRLHHSVCQICRCVRRWSVTSRSGSNSRLALWHSDSGAEYKWPNLLVYLLT